MRYICLVYSGETWSCASDDISFVIPFFVPADLSARCGVEICASNPNELNARVEVLKRIRVMEKVVEQALLDVNSGEVDVYATFKSSDSNKWASVTVSEVARLWKTKPTLSTVYAAHRYLMQYPLFFIASQDHPLSQSFYIRPQAAVDRIQAVTAWTRSKYTPIDSFIAKAKFLLKANARKITRSLRKLDSPSWTPSKDPWSENHRIILTFLLESLRPVRGIQPDPYDIPLIYVMRKVLPNEEEITDAVVHQFLINLGVIAPWQELVTGRADLEMFFGMEEIEKNDTVASKAIEAIASTPEPCSSQPLGPYDLYPTDPLESVRHDFGNLPVYVIDDPTAEELDDGVSIEPVSSHPNQYWVHVHIADPGSVIPPSHVFAKEAYKRLETSYLHHVTIPLFPSPLMFDKKHGMSLVAGDSDRAQRVITFSTRLDTIGNLFETKVAAGYVRNVVRATYDSVNAALGYPLDVFLYPFGGRPEQSIPAPISDRTKKDLSILDKISNAQVKKRYENGVWTVSKDRATISNVSWPTQLKTPCFEGGIFCGYPQMNFSLTKSGTLDVGSRALVSEMMKLASRAASLFALERNLPAIRRVASSPKLVSESSIQHLLNLRALNGYVEWTDTLPHVELQGSADYSLKPEGHFGLGIKDGEGYTRVTSPLRRHSDMMMHWQIASALLNRPPVFSLDWMQSYCKHLRSTERARKRAVGLYETFLATSFLKRWTEDPDRRRGKPNPLDNLYGHIYRPPTHQTGSKLWMTVVQLSGLGMRGMLYLDEPVHGVGDLVPVKIKSIQTGVRPNIELTLR